MKKANFAIRVLVSVGMLFNFNARAEGVLSGAWGDLSPEDQAKVQTGEQVMMTKPGTVWPQIFIYQRLESTPEEAMAVLSDYERQKEYIPDLVYSQIEKRIDKTTCEVGFSTLTHFFIHPRENYTTRELISSYDQGASFRIDWKLISANQLRDVVGYARFETLGTGTLLAYYSYVTPPSVASGQSGRAIAGLQGAVRAIIERVQKLRTENRGVLEQEISVLREALSP
ncbi:hypothetical protein WDW37_17900 [Bdellovibrionota bacterium FG-1]